MWIRLSSKASVPGRDKATCSSVYRTFRDNGLTIKTIAWYARQDDPLNYQAWHTDWYMQTYEEAMEVAHDSVAELVYRFFWLDYMCVSMSSKTGWVIFRGHRLVPMDEAVYLRADISNRLINVITEARNEEAAKTTMMNLTVDERRISEDRMTQFTTLIRRLKNSGFISSVIKMCQVKFYVDEFKTLCDTNPNKTGWANGVIECCGDRAYFRPGKPEDYITKSTFIPYNRDYTWGHPLVKELMTWMNQMFPDGELLHFVLKVCASILYGRNSDKLFAILTGDGDNSKSMFAKLIQATFGTYSIDFPVEMLMKNSIRASGPTPELAQAKGAHIGIMAEPDADDPIQAGKIKRFTGGDRFFARLCHDNGGSIETTFKLFYMCNRIPDIPGADQAVRNRFLIIPFLSRWVGPKSEGGPAPDDPEEQMRQRRFKMDPFFENRIPDLALAFAWVLVEYYPRYKSEGVRPPEIVENHTKQHWEENDPYLNFIQEFIVPAKLPDDTPDMKSTLTVTELYRHYKSWFKDNYEGTTVVSSARFGDEMKQRGRLGPQGIKKRWYGVRLNIDPFQGVPNLAM